MNEQSWDDFFLRFDGVVRDEQTDKHLALYRLGEGGALFAVVEKNSRPLRLDLRCDPLLARTLRDKYETVLAAHRLDREAWNTIIVTGQLSDDEIKDLVRLSYQLAGGSI